MAANDASYAALSLDALSNSLLPQSTFQGTPVDLDERGVVSFSAVRPAELLKA